MLLLAVGAATAALLLASGRPGRWERLAPPGSGDQTGALRSGQASGRGWRAARRERAERHRAVDELPHLVALIAVGAEAGAPVSAAVLHACAAHGGPLVAPLVRAADSLAWGADPVQTWRAVERDPSADPALAPVARALARSASSGASVVRALEMLADDLAAQGRSAREDAARQVGVRAAVPLGVCLLPAFLLLGIVPLVAGMAASLLP